MRAGLRRHHPRDFVRIGDEAVLWTTWIVDRLGTGDRDARSPQWIVGRRDEHLVVAFEERLHAHEDQLRDPVAHEDVVGGDAPHAARLAVHGDRFARGEDPLLVRIPFRLRQILDDREAHRRRRAEAEERRVADVQLDDLVTEQLELLRALGERAADLVADIGEVMGATECRSGHSL